MSCGAGELKKWIPEKYKHATFGQIQLSYCVSKVKFLHFFQKENWLITNLICYDLDAHSEFVPKNHVLVRPGSKRVTIA
jgi:hypothetical protein